MSRFKNPHEPGTVAHDAFETGYALGAAKPPEEPQARQEPVNYCGRATAAATLLSRAKQLREEAALLESLAKFATILDGAAEESLWRLVVNQRT